MKKILISLAAVGMLASCSQEDSETAKEDIETVEEMPPETEQKTEEDPVTIEYLQTRIQEGMDYDTYSVEIQAWVDKGQAEVQDSIEPEGTTNESADIIQVADGFLAVATDGKEITEVKPFDSPEEAKEYINENI